jgi:hypothetical protein
VIIAREREDEELKTRTPPVGTNRPGGLSMTPRLPHIARLGNLGPEVDTELLRSRKSIISSVMERFPAR